MRYCLQLAYDGTAYHGWQSQKNAHSVQSEIEQEIEKIIGTKAPLTGCGRTDTGVHATDYFAHFDIDKTIRPQFVFKLNKMLPHDIAIKALYTVNDDFSARFTTVEREYRYCITKIKSPFLVNKAWHRYGPINIEKMNNAAMLLIGEHDFQAFSKANTQVNHYRCDVRKAAWSKNHEGLIEFTVVADRFLRNMVRAIVGTLLDAGAGKISLDEFQAVIDSRKRGNAGASVPAHGLYLQRVSYPPSALTLLQSI